MHRTIWAVAITLAATILAACGGGEATSEGASEDGAGTAGAEQAEAAPEEVPSPPQPWASMSPQDKAAWMQAEVLPRMSVMFREFDEERYARVTCATCHGPGAASGDFAMPSNALPALPPTGSPEQRAMVAQYGPMLRFMFNHVMPTTQTLVGGEDFDEATGGGFSCFSCHPHQGDEGSTMIELAAPEEDAGGEAAE